MGLGLSPGGFPLDLVGLVLAGLELGSYSLLLTDEFLRLNGMPEERVLLSLERTQACLHRLQSLYGFSPDFIVASELMRTQGYTEVFEEVRKQMTDLQLLPRLLQTVPERHRHLDSAALYPLHEIACTVFLRKTRGIGVKVGPPTERAYDPFIRRLDPGIAFAYLQEAYALGTPSAEPVVPYVLAHRGTGQRLRLDEPLHKAKAKLLLGPDEASRYLLRLASVAGHRLNTAYLTAEEIGFLRGTKLRKAAQRLVLDNILLPYREVATHDA